MITDEAKITNISYYFIGDTKCSHWNSKTSLGLFSTSTIVLMCTDTTSQQYVLEN